MEKELVKSGERSSNLELFRILSMMAIIAHHFVVNSGLIDPGSVLMSNIGAKRSLFLLCYGAWGKPGINCFVLITGYFMCRSNISIRKYVKLLAEIYFYRIVIFGLFCLNGYEVLNKASLIQLILPFTEIDTGFTSCFLVFYLCIPFLNVLVQNISEQMHKRLLLLLGIVYTLVPTMLMHVSFNYVGWFCILYFIASYIRLYPKAVFEKTVLWGVLSVGTVLVSFVSIYACVCILPRYGLVLSPFHFVADSNKILAVATSVSLFLFFKNLKIGYHRIINMLGSATFGVLLIHAASDAMRTWLWKDVLDVVGHYGMRLLPLYAIVCTIGVFAVCAALDLLRIRYLEKPFMSWWDRSCDAEANHLWERFLH